MIRTRFTQVAGVDHPVVCAGMGGGGADGELAGRVSEAGGLGVIGASFLEADAVRDMAAHARAITSKPIGINLLLFATEDLLEAVLDVQPEVLSTAWPREDQDLSAIFARAHELEIKVMHMVPTLDDAKQAAEAGADVIVAQGTDGGGHVGEMGTTVIVRQVAKAVAPVPVLAAGGFADGAGLASALALGADGVLLGTRFVASEECPEPAWLKWRIVASDGHDTVRTTVRHAQRARLARCMVARSPDTPDRGVARTRAGAAPAPSGGLGAARGDGGGGGARKLALLDRPVGGSTTSSPPARSCVGSWPRRRRSCASACRACSHERAESPAGARARSHP